VSAFYNTQCVAPFIFVCIRKKGGRRAWEYCPAHGAALRSIEPGESIMSSCHFRDAQFPGERVLALYLKSLTCLDETEHEGPWPFQGEGIANDAMRLTGVITIQRGSAEPVQCTIPFMNLGDNYEDGRTFPVETLLAAIPVTDGAFPASVSAALVLVEEDYGGVNWDAFSRDVLHTIATVTRAGAATATSAAIGTAIGTAAGPIGTAVGAAVGALVGAIIDGIASAIRDMESDVFPPNTLTLALTSPYDVLSGESPTRSTYFLLFEGAGGLYRMELEWRLGPVPAWAILDVNPRTAHITGSGSRLYQRHLDGKVWRYTGTPITGWELLDRNPATVQIVSDEEKLYQRHDDGKVWRFTGTPLSGWELIDQNREAVQLVASNGQLYERLRDGSVWKFGGSPMSWQNLDRNATTIDIVADGADIYQRRRDGTISRYRAAQRDWEQVGEAANLVAIRAGGGSIYQLRRDGQVWRRLRGSRDWQLIDRNPNTVQIEADGAECYQRHRNGLIWRYTGTPITGWELLDHNPATVDILAFGAGLYQRHRNGMIWKRFPPRR
jgi:hypothetical protein